MSVLFSMLVVWIYRRSRGGAYRRTTPGGSQVRLDRVADLVRLARCH
jgi:hypothetical protein